MNTWKTILKTLVRLMAIAFAIIANGCHLGYDFNGPGYDPKRGISRVDATEMVWLVVTTGEIEHGKSKSFFAELNQVMENISIHEGLVGYGVQKQLIGSRVWTMSVWLDLDSMQRFVDSPSHRQAVQSGGIPAHTVRSAVRKISASRVPISWKEAKRLLSRAANEAIEPASTYGG